VTPLNYVTDGDDYVVIASNGGAPRHPDWYLNLQANPDAQVELAGRRVGVKAETVDDERRERLWALARDSWGPYDAYQRRTPRSIPVVLLRRVAS
jgi:deazaflavin-dependent oxidoreductase (nitroreductase family)